MKILLRILGIIAVLVALGMGTLGVKRNLDDAKEAKNFEQTYADGGRQQLDELKEQAKQVSGPEADALNEQIAEGEKALNDIPSSGTFTTAAIFLVALMLLTFVSAIFLFKAGHKRAVILLAVTAVVTIAAIILAPKIEGNEYSGISNHIIAMIVGIPATLVAFFAFVLRNGTKKPVLTA